MKQKWLLAKAIPFTGKFIPELNGLRSLAVLLVLGHHLHFSTNPFLSWLDQYGWVGVNIFFVLSGYLITSLLVKEHKKNGKIELKSFWLRRFFRLWPCFFVTWLTGGALMIILLRHSPEKLSHFKFDIWGYLLFMANYTITYWQEVKYPFVLNHLWSLAVEEHFYFFWPLLLSFFLPWKSKLTTGLFFLTGFFGSLFIRILYFPKLPENTVNALSLSTETNLDSLFLGGFLAFFIPYIPPLKGISSWGLLIMSFGLFYLGLNGSGLRTPENPLITTSPSWIALASGGLIIFLLRSPQDNLIRKIFRRSWMLWLGRHSYAIYLIHPITNVIVFGALQNLTFPVPLKVPISLCVAIGSSLLAAHWLHKFVETPGIAFYKKKL